MNTLRKRALLQRRRWRIRKVVSGTAAQPRLSLKITGKHIYAQAIDDENGSTLLFLGTVDAGLRALAAEVKQSEAAEELGRRFAEKAIILGIHRVVFDRNGRMYHGNVKAFADAAREAGLKF